MATNVVTPNIVFLEADMPLYHVHPAISDSISQVQTAVLGAAPAMAAAIMQLSGAHAAGMALHNSVFQQQLQMGQQQASALGALRALQESTIRQRSARARRKVRRSHNADALTNVLLMRQNAKQNSRR